MYPRGFSTFGILEFYLLDITQCSLYGEILCIWVSFNMYHRIFLYGNIL